MNSDSSDVEQEEYDDEVQKVLKTTKKAFKAYLFVKYNPILLYLA
jgi:hypothetical protein